MASAIQISMTEYLDTDYRPDREYVDSEVRERMQGSLSTLEFRLC